MPIIRTIKDSEHPYTLINRTFANDKRLCWEARGVMVYLLTKPDGWEIKPEDLIDQAPNGRATVYRVLRELEQYGYIQRIRERVAGGKFDWHTYVYELPLDADQIVERKQRTKKPKEDSKASQPFDALPQMDEPQMAEPFDGSPYMENRQIYRVVSTESSEKEISKKNRAAPKARARAPQKQATTAPLFADESVAEEAIGRAAEKSPHQALIAAFVEEIGYTPATMGAEAKAAKWLVENGYTPEQVVGCYRSMKQDAFWEKKHLSLMSIQKQIGAWAASHRPAARQPVEVTETEEERDARFARLYTEHYAGLKTVHPANYRTPAS